MGWSEGSFLRYIKGFSFCASFLVTPCLVVAVQPCMGWIPIKKKKYLMCDPSQMALEITSQPAFKCYVWKTFKTFIWFSILSQTINNYKWTKLKFFLEEENVNTGFPQCSLLGSVWFLIYIIDLSNRVSSNCKLFTYDMSLYLVVNNIQSSAATLCSELAVISKAF